MMQSTLLPSILTILVILSIVAMGQWVRSSTNQDSGEDISNASVVESSKLNVVASFYPIFDFVKQVGGDKVTVTSLIPVGVEPHDFEPTIQQIQTAESADIIFFNGLGFESSFLDKINNKNLFDTSSGTNVSNPMNPHIWLDPILAKNQVKNIENALIKLDPANKDYYHNNTINFSAELDSLDADIRSILQTCNKKDFITFHNAFSYFANRYGLNQHSIQGVSPEGQVLPRSMQETVELARDLGLKVVYSEELVDPRFAEVIAQEIADAKVLTFSPIEGIDVGEQAAGIGYLDKMKENIANLKIGLECQE
jgi:zinc transport system substrate-binding protein